MIDSSLGDATVRFQIYNVHIYIYLIFNFIRYVDRLFYIYDSIQIQCNIFTFQLAGVATLWLAVNCNESTTRMISL